MANARLEAALELVQDALREILAHPLRSLLTLSGIVFGAASLVSMTSLAFALKAMAYRDLMNFGFPSSYTAWDRGPRDDARGAAALRHKGIREADLAAVRDVPGVASVLGRNFSRDYVVGGPAGQRLIPVEGVDAGYLEMRRYRIVSGRSLRPLDVMNVARVAVVGEEMVRDLFGTRSPVGQTITLEGVRFRVIGVLAPLEVEIAPADFTWVARRIYIPYSYVTRYSEGQGRVRSMLVTAAEDADFGTVMRAGATLLRQRHGGAEDFEIDNEAADVLSDLAMADNILGGWNTVMYAIAGVTIVVGGIGLFSVLLISVRERVREIGIRKAVGADDGDIQRLFMAESLTLAFLGAITGIGGGLGLCLIVEFISHQFGRNFQVPVQLPGVFVAVFFSLAVGVVFGWYPARRAAKLDPIEAISGS